MKRDIVLGTYPFCGNSSRRCQVTPGYRLDKKFKGSGAFKKCWTGHKAKCKYDFNTFKKTPLYQKLKAQRGSDFDEFFPDFKWFGTAPFCTASLNDLADKGYVYVTSDKCGDGRCCITGEKMLGMKPVTAQQQEELEKQQELSKLEKQNKKSVLEDALHKVQQISDIGSKVSKYIPVVGPAVKSITDGINTVAKLVSLKPSNQTTKVSGYNDSYINSHSLTKEIKQLKDNTIPKTPEYIRRYSIIKDVYDRLNEKENLGINEEELLNNLKIFLDEVKKDKTYNIIGDKKDNKKDNETLNKTTKEIVSDIQKNNTKEYLTNFAKDYYKYKNVANTINISD